VPKDGFQQFWRPGAWRRPGIERFAFRLRVTRLAELALDHAVIFLNFTLNRLLILALAPIPVPRRQRVLDRRRRAGFEILSNVVDRSTSGSDLMV
jgi:hypothetical protein